MLCRQTETECRLIDSHACTAELCRYTVMPMPTMGVCITQAALIAASRDRETAQAALAEAKTRQDETTEVSAISVLPHQPVILIILLQGFADTTLVIS